MKGGLLMELILINDSKLKISLSEIDLKQYSLDCNNINYDCTETRRAFWNILDEAKQKTGFDAASQKVFIQLYPSKAGGCEMYITKLGITEYESKLPIASNDSHALRPLNTKRSAYSFESLDRVISVCKRLSYIGFAGNSSALKSTGEKYFLIFEEPEENAYIPLSEYSFISEYGRSENLKYTEMFVTEHAVCICEEKAVLTLSAF
jgi:negative regulator of genetic competence, sporulation and motility